VEAGNFWVKLTISATALASASIFFSRTTAREIFRIKLIDLPIGILSAALLYAIFYIGNIVLTAILPSAEAGIQGVYEPRSVLSSREIGMLLLALTAIAEEVFWRGFIQRLFVRKTNAALGMALGVFFYAGVHAWTLNLPLILAAAVAGTVWALQFQLVKRLPSLILSHALWSTTIFLIFPVI
jgi:hypothetical protein